MKIVCDSCSTKYSISDDKVRGKVFKIRCKKCSHIIVVKGTGEGAAAPPEAANDAVWHLVVEGDQVGPLTDVEVRARLSRGEISSENYVWKEGFSDWLRLAEVPELAEGASAAVSAGGELFSDSPSGGSRASRAEAAAGDLDDQGAGAFSSVAASSQEGREGRISSRSTIDRARAVAAAPVEDDAFSLPAAASRASEGGDLFGMAPMATHADSGRVKSRASNGSSGGMSPRHDGGRVENLTAQRSENSVLFSLSNLQSLAAPSISTKPSSPQNTEGSGLIDIRAMAASTLKGPSFSSGPSMFGGDSKVAADELPTFGAFSSAAPVLFPIPSSSGPPKWLFALMGVAAVLVLIVLFFAFKILSKPMIAEQVPVPVPVVVAPPAPAAPAAPSKPLAEGDLPPRDKPEAAAADKGSDKGSDKGPRSTRHGGSSKGSKKGSGGDTKGDSSGSTAAATPAAPSEPEKAKPAKGSLDDLLEGALNGRKPRRNDDDAPAPKDKKGGGDSGGGGKGPLEKSAVVAGMNGVKGKVQGCFNQFKVPGMAMVNVVISPSGKVTSATVTGKFAGTPTGSCVEGAVKSASFPPSEGLSTPYPFNLR